MLRVFGVVGGALLVAAGVTLSVSEYRAYTLSEIPLKQALFAAEPRGFARSYSFRGRRAQLQRCIEDRSEFSFSLFPREFQETMIQDCLDLAEFSHRLSPSLGNAHLSDARQYYALDDAAAGDASLVYARTGAPEEYAQALRRTYVVFNRAAPVEDLRNSEGVAHDLRIVLAAAHKIGVVATLYEDYPEYQEFLAGLIEETSELTQRMFVDALRNLRQKG